MSRRGSLCGEGAGPHQGTPPGACLGQGLEARGQTPAAGPGHSANRSQLAAGSGHGPREQDSAAQRADPHARRSTSPPSLRPSHRRGSDSSCLRGNLLPGELPALRHSFCCCLCHPRAGPGLRKAEPGRVPQHANEAQMELPSFRQPGGSFPSSLPRHGGHTELPRGSVPRCPNGGLAWGWGWGCLFPPSASCAGDRTRCWETELLKPICEAVRLLPTTIRICAEPSPPDTRGLSWARARQLGGVTPVTG